MAVVVKKEESLMIFQVFADDLIIFESGQSESLVIDKNFELIVNVDKKEKISFPKTMIENLRSFINQLKGRTIVTLRVLVP